jgi:hypothetical protein
LKDKRYFLAFEFKKITKLQWRNLSKDEKQIYLKRAQTAMANSNPTQQAVLELEK